MNVLIAEDEKDINNLLKLNLEQDGYTVFATRHGLEAFTVIQKEPIDLAILDVMMPELDGFNLLRKIRELKYMFPVIFLTARGEDMDKILGLGLGADDYLIKPFSMVELLARINANLRRFKEYSILSDKERDKINYGKLILDKHSCCLYKNKIEIPLNAKEYLLIKYLMENPERIFTKKQLYVAVWEDDFYYDDNTIMVHISHLRNKIETDPKDPKYIKTIRGIGYKLHYQEDIL